MFDKPTVGTTNGTIGTTNGTIVHRNMENIEIKKTRIIDYNKLKIK